MAETLTPQQELAVNDRGGNLLVSAAAGSGKTKVLVDRLLSYLMDPVNPANVDDFLIITYTKAAAAELREKIAAKLTQKIAENPGNRHLHRQLQRLYLTTISTVHSFCSDLLRQYAYMLDLPGDFSVIDDRDAYQLQAAAMEQVLDVAHSDESGNLDFYKFMESQGFHRNDRDVPELIMDFSEKALCHLQPDLWMDQCIAQAEVEGVTDAAQTPWGKYLIDDLHETVNLEIQTLSNAIRAMQDEEGYEKAAALFADIVVQYQRLADADSWDAVIDAGKISYGSLSFGKEVTGSELSENIKKIKGLCKANVDEKLEVFVNRNDQVMEDLRRSASSVRGLVGLVRAYHSVYGKMKRNIRALDFSDLEHMTLDLLYGKSRSGVTAVAKEISGRFREIMVDEYQDSNAIQEAIFDALSQQKHNLFMVGDVKQSIYRFRMADPDIFLGKYNSFLPAADAPEGVGRKVVLSCNFRSGGGVLHAVNDVFERCMSKTVGGLDYTQEEALVEGIPHIPLEDPEVQLLALDAPKESNQLEAQLVAARIHELLKGNHMVRDGEKLRRITPEDIVILLRAPKNSAVLYKTELAKLGIACTDDIEDALFDADEICVIRSLLTVISNPRQDIPLVAALASPVFGYNANDLAELRGANRTATIYDLLKSSENPKAKHFFQILNQLRKEAKVTTISGLVEKLYLHTSLDDIYASMTDGALRTEHLEAFYSLAVAFDARGGGSLEQFLTNLDIMEQKGLKVETTKQTNCVRIMSIHKSKGLEFPVVFLSGLAKRFDKRDMRKKVLLDKELGIGIGCVDEKTRIYYPSIAKSAIIAKKNRELLSEEMRILYVAMTRPRDRLIMTLSFGNAESAFCNVALRMHYSAPALIHMSAGSLASWVIYCALQKTEAGELFALGAYPPETSSGRTVWDIHVVEPVPANALAEEEAVAGFSDIAIDVAGIRSALEYRYPYLEATQTPSKQTATQLKQRYKDSEVSENTAQSTYTKLWREPSFVSAPPSSVERGNAVHAVMQYVDFSKCSHGDSLRTELIRLVDAGLISQEQAEMVDIERILKLFLSPLGKRMLCANKLLREFKFSVLVPAKDSLEGDKVLLQGVVDCAILEEDGITVIDFKSDRVTAENLGQKNEQYAQQVNAYALALNKIFKLPVKEKWLYYFAMDAGVQLN